MAALLRSVPDDLCHRPRQHHHRDRHPEDNCIQPQLVAEAGATNLRAAVDTALFPGVLQAYNEAIVTAFVVSLAMERRSVRGKSIAPGGGAGRGLVLLVVCVCVVSSGGVWWCDVGDPMCA
jgi:hypothetical protein